MLVLMAYFFFHPVTGVYCCHWWFNFNILLQILSSFAVIQNFPSKHFFVFQDICFGDVFSIITFHPPRRLEDDLEDKKMSWSWWDSLSISILLCLDMEEILFWFLFFFLFFFIPSLVFIRWYPDFKIFRDNSKFRLQFWFDLNVFVKLFTNFNNFCSNPNFFLSFIFYCHINYIVSYCNNLKDSLTQLLLHCIYIYDSQLLLALTTCGKTKR